MTIRRNRPVDITDAPEHRQIPLDRVEVRDDSDDTNILNLEGYASTHEPYELYGGPANGGWIEQMDNSAFDKTLREKPDLHLLINHAGMPLARTKSGTLQLSHDENGLKVNAQLDKRDPEVQALAVKMARGDMDEMSFAFRVKGQKWESTPEFEDDPQALRTITEVSLHKGDVSVVNWGANPATHAEVKSAIDALEVLANCDSTELAEMRSDNDLIARVRIVLDSLGKPFMEETPVEAHADTIAGAEEAIAVVTLEPRDGVDTSNEVSESDTNAEQLTSEERADGDPSALVSALDATLDEASNLIVDVDRSTLPTVVAQALDLIVAAETIVDSLMELLGIYDPDDDEELSAKSALTTVIEELGAAGLLDAFRALLLGESAQEIPVEDVTEELAEEAVAEEPEARGMSLRFADVLADD